MTLHELVKLAGLRPEATTMLPAGGGGLKCPFELTAEDFLDRAEDDFRMGGTSAQVNALTNAKRAIDCQIDTVVAALGYDRNISRRKKLQFLAEGGFIAPRILKRVVDARNLLEHEYRVPSDNQVEEALDIAALFVGAVGRHLDTFEGDYSLGNVDEQVDEAHFSRQLTVSFNHEHQLFAVVGRDRVHSNDEVYAAMEQRNWQHVMPVELGRVDVDATNATFTSFVRLANTRDREVRIVEGIEAFFRQLATKGTA